MRTYVAMRLTSWCVLVLLPSLGFILITPSCSDKGAFSYVLSPSSAVEPLYGVRLNSTVPAVDLALQYINSNSTLLPGLNLTYGQVESLEVSLIHQILYQ